MTTEGTHALPPTVESRIVLTRPSRANANKRHPHVLLLAGFLSVAVAVVWGSLFTIDRFVDRDAFDYAQIGRQLAHHEGFTTRQVFPRHIPYLDGIGLLKEAEWPSLLRYPIPPIMNAAAQAVFNDPARSAVVQSGLWFLITVPLFFLLIERLSDLRSAVLGTVLLVGDPRIWRDAYNGMTESLAVLLQLCFFSIVFRRSTLAGRRRSWILLGIVCGLAFLVRTQSAVLVPLGIFLIFAVPDVRRRVSCLVGFSGAVAATVSPWFARNYLVTRDPMFAFTNTRNLLAKTLHHSRIDLELDAPVDLTTVLTSYGNEIAAKIWSQIWPNLVNPSFWVQALGWYAVAYFAAAVLGRFSRKDHIGTTLFPIFERIVPVLIGMNFLVISMIYHRQRYYDPLIPLMIIVLVIRVPRLLEKGITRFWPRGGPSRSAIFFVLMLIAGVRAAGTYVDHIRQPGIPEVDIESYNVICTLIEDDGLVASDLSAQITLFCGVRTLRLPRDLQDLLVVDDRYIPIDLVVVDRRLGEASVRSFLSSGQFVDRFERLPDLPNGAAVFRKTRRAAISEAANAWPLSFQCLSNVW